MTARRLDSRQIEVVEDEVARILRLKTPGERIAMVDESWCFAKKWIYAVVRSQHGEWDHDKIISEVLLRMSHGSS